MTKYSCSKNLFILNFQNRGAAQIGLFGPLCIKTHRISQTHSPVMATDKWYMRGQDVRREIISELDPNGYTMDTITPVGYATDKIWASLGISMKFLGIRKILPIGSICTNRTGVLIHFGPSMNARSLNKQVQGIPLPDDVIKLLEGAWVQASTMLRVLSPTCRSLNLPNQFTMLVNRACLTDVRSAIIVIASAPTRCDNRIALNLKGYAPKRREKA
ncbi:hypothetical protein BD769DRAFT_1641378 [Suillus cothurnatus]|nr:hypothetical protein BD769DRAFT_1641378 [Suillus cothurnatus]